MAEPINDERRRFLSTAAMTIATVQLGVPRTVDALPRS